jgi:hypothetical protein
MLIAAAVESDPRPSSLESLDILASCGGSFPENIFGPQAD